MCLSPVRVSVCIYVGVCYHQNQQGVCVYVCTCFNFLITASMCLSPMCPSVYLRGCVIIKVNKVCACECIKFSITEISVFIISLCQSPNVDSLISQYCCHQWTNDDATVSQ